MHDYIVLYHKVFHRWFGASFELEASIDVENVEFRIIWRSSSDQMNNNIKSKAERNNTLIFSNRIDSKSADYSNFYHLVKKF